MVGTIAHGHCECYWIMDPDIAKDANMNMTVVSKTLDFVSRDCEAQECTSRTLRLSQ